jgi:hypothetical protein
MIAGLLHTKWRADREQEPQWKGKMVPRWKTIDMAEFVEWESGLTAEQRDSYRGVVFERVNVAKADQKGWLQTLQSFTDDNRSSDTIASQNYDDCRNESTFEILECVRQYQSTGLPAGNNDDETMIVVDINNDFAALPPSWKKENLLAAQGTLSIIQQDPLGEKSNDDLADAVHNDWLARNTWAKDDPKVGVPYERLTRIEQAKDMSQVLVCRLVVDLVADLRKLFDQKAQGKSTSRTVSEDELDSENSDQSLDSDGIPVSRMSVVANEEGKALLHSSQSDAAAPKLKRRQLNFADFVGQYLQSIEGQISHELYGVDMVSVCEQIAHRKITLARQASLVGNHDTTFTGTISSGGSGSGSVRDEKRFSTHIDAGASGFHVFISYRRTGLSVAGLRKLERRELSTAAGEQPEGHTGHCRGVDAWLLDGGRTLGGRWALGGRESRLAAAGGGAWRRDEEADYSCSCARVRDREGVRRVAAAGRGGALAQEYCQVG